MPRDERLELGNELCRPPGREICLDALLERRQPQFLEPCNLAAREGGVRQFRKWCATPEGERLAQRPRSDVRLPGRQGSPSLVQQRVEAMQIELARRNPQRVPVRSREQHAVVDLGSVPRHGLALEQPAQP